MKRLILIFIAIFPWTLALAFILSLSGCAPANQVRCTDKAGNVIFEGLSNRVSTGLNSVSLIDTSGHRVEIVGATCIISEVSK